MKKLPPNSIFGLVKRWCFLPIVFIVCSGTYFWMLKTIEEEKKTFVARKISNAGKDELGIRANRPAGYYDEMLKFLEREASKFSTQGKPVPERILTRIERVKKYRKSITGD